MRTLLWIIVAVAVGVYNCGPIVDPDLWWHITIGRWILAQGTVPVADHWTLFGQGMAWRAYSWLFEVIVAGVDGAWGAYGLIGVKLVVAVSLSLTLCFVCARLSRDYFFGLLLGVFVTCACYNHFTLRPQSIVWILLALLFLAAERIAHEGPRRALLLRVFLIMVVWANMHISTILGLFALSGWLFANHDLAVRDRSRWQWRTTLLVGAVGFLGTLVTPYVGGEWLTFSSTSSHPFAFKGVNEFQPATILQYSTAFLIIQGALLLAFLHRAPASIELPKLLVAGVFTLGALAVVKFLPFAAISLGVVCACVWRRISGRGEITGNLGEGFRRLRVLIDGLPREALAFVFLCTIIVNLNKNRVQPLAPGFVPVKSLDFILAHDLPRPILNAFGEGGYVMYRLSDAAGNLSDKVSIDGRTNLIDDRLWDAFVAAMDGRERWREYLTMVKPRTILWRPDSPLYPLLLESKEWCHVFQEEGDTQRYAVLVSRSDFSARPGAFQSKNCS